MQTWFEVKTKYVKIDDDGREKKVSEMYLVDGVSCTDAEARLTAELRTMIRGEFIIGKVVTSNIVEIFPYEDGQFWWKAKISIITIDENAGKEKKINSYFLIAADKIEDATKRLREGLNYVLVPFEITAISISPIVDVFPYFGNDTSIPSNLKPISKQEDDLEEIYNSDDESDTEA